MRTFIILFLLNIPAWAGEIKLLNLDQKKLGELLGKLPLSVRGREMNQIPNEELIITSRFPLKEAPFHVQCTSGYFNGSPYFAYSKCSLKIDENHLETLSANDEYKISITDPEIVSALFQNISYQNTFKELRSYGKRKGINFEGKETFIFNYYLRCDLNLCIFKVSKLADSVEEDANPPLISGEP